MALNLDPALTVKFVFEDITGSRGACVVHLPSATLAADAKTKADALVPLLAAVTGASILGYGITYGVTNTAPAGAIAGCEVEQKGVLIGRAANGLPVRLEIPGFLHTKTLDSGAIDPASGDVTALTAALTGTAPIPCSLSGSAISDITDGYIRFRGTRKWQKPRDTGL